MCNMVHWTVELLNGVLKISNIMLFFALKCTSLKEILIYLDKSNGKPTTIGHFQSSESLFGFKYYFDLPETFFQLEKQPSMAIKNIFNFIHF